MNTLLILALITMIIIFNIVSIIYIIKTMNLIKNKGEIMKYGISSKKGYEINYKRYFLASKIGSKSIINRIKIWLKVRMYVLKLYFRMLKTKLENVLEWVGYHYIGYKEDIKVNTLSIVNNYEEYKKLQNNHNNLALDYSRNKNKVRDKVISENTTMIKALENKITSENTTLYNKIEKDEVITNNMVKALEDKIRDEERKNIEHWHNLDEKINVFIQNKSKNVDTFVNNMEVDTNRDYVLGNVKEALSYLDNDGININIDDICSALNIKFKTNIFDDLNNE